MCFFFLGSDTVWPRYNYLNIWNLRVQKNIEKIAFKVVQMKFLAMYITNQNGHFDIFMVRNLQNIFMEHDLYLIYNDFWHKRKINFYPFNVFLAIVTNISQRLKAGFVVQGHILYTWNYIWKVMLEVCLSVSVICQLELVNQFWWISIWMERSASVSVSSVQYDNIYFVTLITDATNWGRIIASAPSELCICLKHYDCRLLVSVHHNLVHAQLTIHVKELYWLNKLMLTLMINSNTPFLEILVVICHFLSEWSSRGQFGV